ncbi:MAG: WbqC family protein [Alphaproteobacteria bacterium]|nr:WbqC family protein [Alphaproteobacteria bacterium]
MKVCVMQPYFFPYLGYWQMISAVDTFVIFDDVNYINKGWINRNNILVNGQAWMFTLPLDKASQNKLINEIELGGDLKTREKILRTVQMSYKKAPFYDVIYPLVEKAFLNPQKNLALFLKDHFESVFDFLDIKTKIILSSDVEKDNSLKGQDKILQICRKLDCDTYINTIAGEELYSYDAFAKQNMQLRFIKMKPVEYAQYKQPFVPNLSFIDVMMFNDKARIKDLLLQYDSI